MKYKDKLILDTAEKHYSDSAECLDAFLHGVEFSESLSPWISVEDDLPYKHKKLFQKSIYNTPITKLVFIRNIRGYYYTARMYNFKDEWYWESSEEITHWMPIPEI